MIMYCEKISVTLPIKGITQIAHETYILKKFAFIELARLLDQSWKEKFSYVLLFFCNYNGTLR